MREIKIFSINTLANIPTLIYWLLLGILALGLLLICLNAILFNHNTNDCSDCGYACRSKNQSFGRYIARLMLVEWVFLIFCTTLFLREPGVAREVNLMPFWSYVDYAENCSLWEMTVINLLNVCMFFPVGFFLKFGVQNMTWKNVLTAGLVLSVFIELTQFVFRLGLCEIDDVIHNVLGCMLGYGVATLIGLANSKERHR